MPTRIVGGVTTLRRLGASLAAVVVLSSSCGDADPAPTRSPRPSPAGEPIAADWADLADFRPVEIDRWRLLDCDGDAPLLCVERGGAPVGHLELLQFDRDTFGPNARSLDALADDHEASFRRDRSSGCPESFEFVVHPRADVNVAGKDGVRTTWSVSDAYGNEVERVVTYFGLREDRVVLFGANGLTGDACIGREGGGDFTPGVLAGVVPVLDRVVAGSVLPEEIG